MEHVMFGILEIFSAKFKCLYIAKSGMKFLFCFPYPFTILECRFASGLLCIVVGGLFVLSVT